MLTTRFRVRLLPSPGSFLAFIALLAALGPGLAPMFGSDGDVGRHIRVGRQIIADRQIPAIDTLSHTRYGAEWVPKEWLAQVAFAGADRASGLAGAATLAAVLFAVAVTATFATARLLGGSLGASLGVAVVSMLLQTIHLLPRPHLFTTAIGAVLLLLLVQFRRTGRIRWIVAVPLLFLAWVNLHGGFPAGLALLGLFCADAWMSGRGPEIQRQKWLLPLAGVLAIVATLLNPVGPAIWSHVLGHLGNVYLMGITEEFRSPDFHASWARLLLATILGTGLLLALGKRRLPVLGLAILLGTLAAALVSVRHVTLFATLGIPWLTPALGFPRRNDAEEAEYRWPGQPIRPLDERIASASSALLPVMAALVLVSLANGPLAHRARFDPTVFPVAAMDEVGRLQTGAIFNEMDWGGYLLYTYPEIKIFIDGHADFFGEDLVREYRRAREGGPGWDLVLEDRNISWTVMRRGAALSQLLEVSPDWDIHFADSVAAIFQRTGYRLPPGGSGNP